MKTLIYLATPYSDPDPAVRKGRFDIVNRVAADLMRDGLHIFSPISHAHPIALAGNLPKCWEFWQEYDRAILAACAKMIVLMQDGWKTSVGVTAERKLATKMSICIDYMKTPLVIRELINENKTWHRRAQ